MCENINIFGIVLIACFTGDTDKLLFTTGKPQVTSACQMNYISFLLLTAYLQGWASIKEKYTWICNMILANNDGWGCFSFANELYFMPGIDCLPSGMGVH